MGRREGLRAQALLCLLAETVEFPCPEIVPGDPVGFGNIASGAVLALQRLQLAAFLAGAMNLFGSEKCNYSPLYAACSYSSNMSTAFPSSAI